MKIVEVAFALLVFNICVGAASHALLTPYPVYYESEYITQFNPDDAETGLPTNISTVSETQQYSTTMNIVELVMSVTDFGWIYMMIPDELDVEFMFYIGSLQAIVGFFYAIAIIEFFVKQYNILGGSK